MAAASCAAASYPPIAASSSRWRTTASWTARGGSAEPALLKWSTRSQPGVSRRARWRSMAGAVIARRRDASRLDPERGVGGVVAAVAEVEQAHEVAGAALADRAAEVGERLHRRAADAHEHVATAEPG